MTYFRQIITVIIFSFSFNVCAQSDFEKNIEKNILIDSLSSSPSALISAKVKENYTFFGLASYYNNINYYILENENLDKIHEGKVYRLRKPQWLVVVGHLNVLLIKSKDLLVHLNDSMLIIDNQEILKQSDVIVKIISKSDLSSISPELDFIRYSHLWEPLAWLSKVVESSLVFIHEKSVTNWGLTIIVFAVLLKLLLLPVTLMTVRFQRKVAQLQTLLSPQLVEIKANYNGEEAHNRLMAAHKELSVSPFYTLKPMLGYFIQIPILIAVFNALGEMPQLDGQSFLWIENLAYPDSVGHISFSIPMFGNALSLLPFIMTLVTIYSTVIFKNRHALQVEVKRQKRNLYFMAAAFFVLFYTFPAAMVLYWALANILHMVQQQIIEI